MSLKSLTSVHSVTIKRESVTNTDSMSNQRTHTTAARGSLPTTLKCRIVPLTAREREEHATADTEKTHAIFSTTDPQVDSRDVIEYGSDQYHNLATENPDKLGRFYRTLAEEFTSGVQ